jgi:hypothetical protein
VYNSDKEKDGAESRGNEEREITKMTGAKAAEENPIMGDWDDLSTVCERKRQT